MRNEVPDNENVYNSVVARRNRRRKQAIAGVAGLAVLGAGAFLVTAQVADQNQTEAKETTALAAQSPTAVASSRGASSAPSVSSADPTPAKSSAGAEKPKTVEDRAKVARNANKQRGTEVRRPLNTTPEGARAAAATAGVQVRLKTYGSVQKDKETLKVYSAKDDLTGYRELGWVAGDGEKVGDSRCSQSIRLSNNQVARVRPTLLICWRTSAEKSVYTVAVDLDGKPSTKKSVSAIKKEWARLD
jgi:hypothetical protein